MCDSERAKDLDHVRHAGSAARQRRREAEVSKCSGMSLEELTQAAIPAGRPSAWWLPGSGESEVPSSLRHVCPYRKPPDSALRVVLRVEEIESETITEVVS